MMTDHPVIAYTMASKTNDARCTLANGREFDRPGVYEIQVKGAVDAGWASYWFEGFAVTPQPDETSLLTGLVADQSALLGLLARIRDLGLPLLSVRRVGHDEMSDEIAEGGYTK